MLSLFKKSMPRAVAQKPLYLHNTLSGKLELFESLNGTVRMYNCGPTPYDEQHIGNLFPPVVANVLRRTLELAGYPVNQVTNITDFGHLTSDGDEGDDKMTQGLKREGMSMTMENMRKLAEKYAEIFFTDIAELGIDASKITFPRASDYIPEQIALIKALEEKSYAYKTSDGVYFDTAKFAGYGKLGRIPISALKEGARVEANSEKKNPADFALWKFDTKKDSENSLGWDSPWGKGFPGWHIECTAMIFTLLGRQIDIHTGGIEHIPVHHNNEIAQAEAVTGKQFVRYWLHNDHITIEGKKISKSLGNTVYLHNITDRGLNARALRYWFLTGHYRTPMNFTWDALDGANTALKRLQRAFLEMPAKGGAANQKFLDEFYGFILQDLDTPKALARVWDLMKDESVSPADKRASLIEADKILGLGINEYKVPKRLQINVQDTIKLTDNLTISITSEFPAEVRRLMVEREKARSKKDFQKSNEIRDKILELGYEIEDGPGGGTLIKK
ncbi:MAG TPA: cysteine--tRNA ligase [Candidatus Paceibacterota bacterium]|nr:cysteine--tRNA ligase [Candidatus Paceibacterota bacterium]